MIKGLQLGLAIVLITMMTTLLHAAEFGSNSANISNPYIGPDNTAAFIHAGYGTKNMMYEYGHTVGTDIVDGVKCYRHISIRTEFAEYNESWVAQDTSGDIYFLKYWDGEDPEPVVLGKDNAVLLLPADPQVNDVIFGDKTVLQIGVTVPQLSTGLGPFTNCLKTQETDGDIVYYAPNVGEVKKEYAGEVGGYELKEIITTDSGTRVVVIPF